MPSASDTSAFLDPRAWNVGSSPALGRVLPLVCSLLILVAHAPFLVLYGNNLWRYHPHYEFFPLLLAVSLYLFWHRWPRPPVASPGLKSRLLATALLGAGFVTLTGAVLLYSPWLAAVAVVLTSGGLIVRMGGRQAFVRLLPVWLLLWLVVRPPLGLDDRLIQWLQSVTALESSQLLDLLGILHQQMGNVIRLPDRDLFVAEACSGIHSQLVLIACAALLVIVERRHWFHSILLIASAVFWAVLANLGRVTIVSVVHARAGLDLSAGWQHELLGYAMVGLGFLMVLSTDQLLKSLLAAIPIDRAFRERPSPLSKTWNRVIAPRTAVTVRPGREDPDLLRDASSTGQGLGVPCRQEVPIPSFSPTWRASIIVAVPFVALGILQMLAITGKARTEMDFPAVSARAFDESTLPAQIDRWKRTDYSSEHTDRPGATAEFGHSWLYTADDLPVHVSVDYPFGGWHELTICYKNIGWSAYERQVKEPQSRFQTDGGFAEVDLCKPTGEYGLLLFGLFDMTGQPLSAGGLHGHQWIQRIVHNPLLSAIGYTQLPAPSSITTIQVQVFVVDDRPVTFQQRQTMREHFELFRHLLRGKWMEEAEEVGSQQLAVGRRQEEQGGRQQE